MMKIPEDDSEDLTDDEIALSVKTSGPQALGDRVVNLSCTVCGERVISEHALRRRAPHLYSRTRVVCLSGHSDVLVFTVDWLKK